MMKKEKIMKKYLLLVLLAMSGGVFAAREYVTRSSSGDYYYYLLSNQKDNQGGRYTWIEIVLSKPEWSNNMRKISFKKQYYYFNCKGQNKFLSFTSYDNSGEVIESNSFSFNGAWDYIVPDSVGEGIQNYVCRR